MEKVVVIGSNSFSGSHYIRHLLKKNYSVVGMSRSPEKSELYLPYHEADISSFTFHQLNLNRDIDEMLRLIDRERPSYIVNFASQSMVGQSWQNPEHWYQTNVVSTVKLTNHLKNQSYLKKYVHISTPEVYGSCTGAVTEKQPHNPSTPYAGSRSAADQFIQMLVGEFSFPAVFTRAANVYGPGQQLFKIIPRAIIYMKLGRKVPLHGGGKARRAFIHIRDVCKATEKVMIDAKPGDIFHLSTGELVTIRGLVKIIAEQMGCSFENAVRDVETRKGLDDAYILDSSKARDTFGWTPDIALKTGIKETIAWVEKEWKTIEQEPLEYIHKE